jgi:hypothetical protein
MVLQNDELVLFLMRGGHREGAGRKPGSGNPMVMFYIRVPAELKEKLDKIKPEKIRMELSKIVETGEYK